MVVGTSLDKRIRIAMDTSPSLWRTIRGIAAELNVRPGEVWEILDSNDGFVKSNRTLKGQELWTTREHFRIKASWWTKFLERRGK